MIKDKDWDRQREEVNALRYRGPDVPEEEHFFTCADCGQAADKRRLGDVINHMTSGHEPIPRN